MQKNEKERAFFWKERMPNPCSFFQYIYILQKNFKFFFTLKKNAPFFYIILRSFNETKKYAKLQRSFIKTKNERKERNILL